MNQAHGQKRVVITLIFLSVLVFQLLYISQNFDAYGLVMQGGAEGWRLIFGHLGALAKWLVLLVFILGLLLKERASVHWLAMLDAVTPKRACLWLCAQLISFLCLLWLTQSIFAHPHHVTHMPAMLFVAWSFAGLMAFIFWCLVLAPFAYWRNVLVQERFSIAISAAVAVVVWSFTLVAKEAWGPFGDLTFYLSALLMLLMNGEQVFVDVDQKLLGLGDFVVNVAPACSGYEGVGLVTAFTAIYLYLYKNEFRFPRAFLLFPIGAIFIWILNIVRISMLISIGHFWSPEIAVGGFHSQAGWLTFIVTSLFILWLARASAFFNGSLPRAASGGQSRSKDNLAVAALMPLVVLLAAVLMTSALSASFDWLYPLRVFAVLIVLFIYRSVLTLWPCKWRWEPIAAGVFVAVLWVLTVPNDVEFDQRFTESLGQVNSIAAMAWLALRFAGAVITVPIAEELGFRAYLLCRLSQVETRLIGKLPLSALAVLASSLAFGALHGAWLAGTLAGLVYAGVRLRSDHIGDAIIAHSLTNALLFGYAGVTGDWHLI